VAAGDAALELVRGALGNQAAVVQQRDPVGELVRLLQVLVVRKIVTPPATRSRMICHTVRRLRGSRPVVGSSRKTIRGSPTRPMARSSRRRMPPE
jgi:hypothetical protein